MRVITGRAYTPTPVLADRITHVVVNPYWHVPPSIAAEEILPEIKKEPGRLLWRGMRIFTGHDDEAAEVPPWMVDWAAVEPEDFPYILRQDPGAENPLGRLKFMFPNRFAVYLHDTPASGLFDGADRARSHGCVRVEHPLALAAFALSDDPRWDRDAIEKAVATGERRRIDLPRELPVYLLYWTAWGEPDGDVSFREDLYGFDERLTLALLGLAS
jgi:L,D-transpeptidase YcbB